MAPTLVLVALAACGGKSLTGKRDAGADARDSRADTPTEMGVDAADAGADDLSAPGDATDAAPDAAMDSPSDTRDAGVPDATGDRRDGAATCPDGATGTDGSVQSSSETLAEGLNYPSSLWIKGTKVYLLEAATLNTSFGGRTRLSVYDTITKQLTTLLENPPDAYALAITEDGKLYLGAWLDSVPGEKGHVSVLDLGTLQVIQSIAVPIAVTDLYAEGNDVYVAGSSDDPSATSISVIRQGVVTPFRTGLGRVSGITKVGTTTYYAHATVGINRFVGTDGPIERACGRSNATNVTSSATQLFYAGSEPGVVSLSTIGSVDQQTMLQTRMPLAGLPSVSALRFDPTSGRLYYLEEGSGDAEFKNGRLRAIAPSIR